MFKLILLFILFKILIFSSSLTSKHLWTKTFLNLKTESAIRLHDANLDGEEDIIIGFAIDEEDEYTQNICKSTRIKKKQIIKSNFTDICLGGILIIDGRNSKLLGKIFFRHEIFAIECVCDLNGDSIKDCVVSGRAGTLSAIDITNNKILWSFEKSFYRVDTLNFYTGQFIKDLNGDGIEDYINIHGGDPFAKPYENRLSGKILILSGKTGNVLFSFGLPENKDSFFSPVININDKNEEVLIFGTGGETQNGSLWEIKLKNNILNETYWNKKNKEFSFTSFRIIESIHKGFMTPPVLIDITNDNVKDIIIASFNSTIYALNGKDYKIIWTFKFYNSETYSTPAPGFYNNDTVPDFLVQWQVGSNFPDYYYTLTTIIDGKSGLPLIFPYIYSSMSTQASPISVSMEVLGSDYFVFWSHGCKFASKKKNKYFLDKDLNVHTKSSINLCKKRFNTWSVGKLLALKRNDKNENIPEIKIIYDTDKYSKLIQKEKVEKIISTEKLT